jgi:hypothetical protein
MPPRGKRKARVSVGDWVKLALTGAFLAGVGVLSYISVLQWELGGTDREGWQPMFWPMRADAWPKGRAWHRDGTEVYLRVKAGYCGDCEVGIASDDAHGRAVDIDLLHPGFTPTAPGTRIRITDLFGRGRLYRRSSLFGEERAQAIAVTYNCNLVVAIVVGDVEDKQKLKAAHLFLESNTVQIWLNKLLDSKEL